MPPARARYRLTCTIANHDDLGQYGDAGRRAAAVKDNRAARRSTGPIPAPALDGRSPTTPRPLSITAATRPAPGPLIQARASIDSAPHMTVDPARYREAIGHFATGVAVVTCHGPTGPPA